MNLDPNIFGDDAPKKNLCRVEGCSNPRHRNDRMCAAHVKRRERGQPLDVPLRPRHVSGQRPPCAVAVCTKPSRFKGLCVQHYKRLRAGKDIHTPLIPQRPRSETAPLSVFRVSKQTMAALRLRSRESKLPVATMARRVLEEWAAQFLEDRRSSESRVLSEVTP